MATSFENCCICDLRHISKLSVVWCSDCNEGLCQECKEHHSFSKASRNHTVFPIGKYETLPAFIENIKLHCDEHDEKYLLFCKEHNECACRKCVISEKHRKCKEISPLADVVKNVKTSVAFTEIVSSLQEMKGNVALILEDRRMNMYSISASIERIESEISVTRQQINHHLDKLQDHFIAELAKAVENSTKEIQSFIMALTKNQRDIEEWIQDVESIKKHATDMQTFLGITNLETKLNKTSNDLQSWIDGNHLSQTVVSYHLNTLLHNIINERTKFGKIDVHVMPSKLSLKRRMLGQAQMIKENAKSTSSLEHMTLELKTKMNTNAFNVSGCCILPNGNFIVSNYDPSYLILIAADGKTENKISSIMQTIIDVTCVDNETVAVISYTQKNIELISLKSGKTIKNISTSDPALCLIYTEGTFIVCLENGQMKEFRLEDNKTDDIVSTVVSRSITELNNTLYSVKKDTNTIVCHKRNGDIVWTFTNEKVLKKPRGIAVDEHGNAIVAGVESNNVIVISADGTKHKILLSQTDLCGSPWAVSFNNKFKYLLVSNDKDGRAFLYSVNYS
ncbi:uncharacterized protein LOC127706828 [Mytilus californianus]|uniref:uncharacterized protein LOC127706828 n=1 Tax=Mytilus californianus TaxID=6549 RepID=UPI002245D4C9|nr:uncharacterized protein LOC127706828 [Mytilus californianus]